MSDHDRAGHRQSARRRFEAERPNQRWVGDVTEILALVMVDLAVLGTPARPGPVFENRDIRALVRP